MKPLFACVGILVLGLNQASNAATITEFEEIEGFKSGARTVIAGSPSASWDLIKSTSKARSFISNAQAKSGAFSWAMLGGALAEHAIQAIDPDSLPNFYSYSFTAPDAVYAPQATTSWIYVNLWNGNNQTTAGTIQVKTRFGTSASGAYQIQYSTWNSEGAHSFAVLNIAQDAMRFDAWNTVAVSLDYSGKTYSVLLNGSVTLSNIPLGPAQQKATTMSGSWIVSGNAPTLTPDVYATTYYDDITVSSNPAASAEVMRGAVTVGGEHFFRHVTSNLIISER